MLHPPNRPQIFDCHNFFVSVKTQITATFNIATESDMAAKRNTSLPPKANTFASLQMVPIIIYFTENLLKLYYKYNPKLKLFKLTGKDQAPDHTTYLTDPV